MEPATPETEPVSPAAEPVTPEAEPVILETDHAMVKRDRRHDRDARLQMKAAKIIRNQYRTLLPKPDNSNAV